MRQQRRHPTANAGPSGRRSTGRARLSAADNLVRLLNSERLILRCEKKGKKKKTVERAAALQEEMKRRRRGSWQLHFASSFTSAAVKHANVGHISGALAFRGAHYCEPALETGAMSVKAKGKKKDCSFQEEKGGEQKR